LKDVEDLLPFGLQLRVLDVEFEGGVSVLRVDLQNEGFKVGKVLVVLNFRNLELPLVEIYDRSCQFPDLVRVAEPDAQVNFI